MSNKFDASEETKLAQEIVAVLPAGSVARFCSDDAGSIRFAVQASDLKLRSVVFRRASLRSLLTDAARAVKIEYLQRDILRNAVRRVEYRYPRLNHLVEMVRGQRKAKAAA
ncbi:MAG TPA: hypothetical protein VFT12_13755, partial [Thermoanaerobaculia bacterium]|nr:hypothetical protein [Thermoanaerobaculia bacterium]